MQDDTIIKVDGLSKEFKLPHEKNNSVKSMFVNFYKRDKSYELQQALKGISFEIKKGEFFGIVGRNGSGKSTLLKILAGVYVPTKGQAEVRGKLTPFIELGVGFNPELTGRENVYLNGALLGFNRKEMRAMYKDIVEFAELERFMDQKLKNYSSGMQVRLAFSIAIQAKNDILIFDEVLAVGDEAFQRKCLDIFEKYKADKQTVVLVTHDMETVRKFCSRAMLINEGKIIEIGDPHEVASSYSELNLREIEREVLNRNSNKAGNNLGLKIHYKDRSSKKTALYKCGEQMRVQLSYDKSDIYQHLVINIYKLSGEHLTGFRIPAASGNSEVEIDALFSRGKYYTLVQAVNDKDEAVGDTVIGPDFVITTDKAPGVPGWSGLVPINYRVVKQ